MDVWVLVLTFTFKLLDVDIIAQHSQWLFTTKAACEEVRPGLEAKAPALAPHGYASPLTQTLTACMPQQVLSAEEALAFLKAHEQPSKGMTIPVLVPPPAEPEHK